MKKLLITLTLIFCSSFINAQAEAGLKSSVWKISDNEKELYLGGSIHILREKDFPLPAQFDYAFENSDVLVLETDEISESKVAEMLMSRIFLTGDKTLKTVLDNETYMLLASKCLELGMPVSRIMKMKPGLVVNVLTVLQMQKYGLTQEGADFYYHAKAKAQNKKVDFLESVEFQINLLVDIGVGYENEYVLYSLDDLNKLQEADLEVMISEWRRGDAPELELSIIEMERIFPDVYKDLITDRNTAWIPLLEKYIQTPETEFVIAGLAHLLGDNGILKVLEEKGYKVEQLETPCAELPTAEE